MKKFRWIFWTFLGVGALMLVGAALLVRRTAIERAGLLDAGFQMYSEELEWQRRIRGMGDGSWGLGSSSQPPTPNSHPPRIVYMPDAVIIHHEGKSSEQAPAQRYLNFQRSRLRDAASVRAGPCSPLTCAQPIRPGFTRWRWA